MEKTEENDIKIANYFEHAMTAEEEQGFMEELAADEVLQKQYEEALFIRALLVKEDENSFTAQDQFLVPADDHLKMMEAALENKNQKKDSAPILGFWDYYKNIAAALLIVAGGTAVYLLSAKKTDQKITIAEKQKAGDSVTKNGSPVRTHAPLFSESQNMDSVFKKFYSPYSGENDPVEISNYYNDYRKQKYYGIIAAKDADYLVMGSNDKAALLKQYMFLYKGLAFLAENKPQIAVQQFDGVLHVTGDKERLYYDAQWYKALALLKENETGDALRMATIISASGSPYKIKAGLLAKELKGKAK